MKFLVTIRVYNGGKVTLCKLLRSITGASLRDVKAIADSLSWESDEIDGCVHYYGDHELILSGDQVGMLEHTWHDGPDFPDSWSIISVKRLTQVGISVDHLGCDFD